jgi:hypothetical protein
MKIGLSNRLLIMNRRKVMLVNKVKNLAFVGLLAATFAGPSFASDQAEKNHHHEHKKLILDGVPAVPDLSNPHALQGFSGPSLDRVGGYYEFNRYKLTSVGVRASEIDDENTEAMVTASYSIPGINVTKAGEKSHVIILDKHLKCPLKSCIIPDAKKFQDVEGTYTFGVFTPDLKKVQVFCTSEEAAQ